MNRRFSDLFDGDEDELRRRFQEARPAPEGGPVPPGRYTAVLVHGERRRAQASGNPAAVLRYEISEGPLQGRCLWQWNGLTKAATPFSKRELALLQITDLQQLDRPLPRYRCELDVTLRQEDDGREFNRVRIVQVLGLDEPPPNPFAPAPLPPSPTAPEDNVMQPPAGANDERG